MPSTSQSQQQAAGIALAVKRGKRPKSFLYGASKNMYKMSVEELEKFARTKHKGLPKRKRKKKKVNEAWGQKIEIYLDIVYRWLEERGFSENEIDTILEDPTTIDAIESAEAHGINPVEAIKELDLEEILSASNVNENEEISLNANNLDFYVNKILQGLSSITANNFIIVKGSTNLTPSISINFALGSSGEWPNGIIQNDPGYLRLMIHTNPQGASLSLLTRNFKQNQAGIKPPRQVKGKIDSVIDYLIKYMKEFVPQIEKTFPVNESYGENNLDSMQEALWKIDKWMPEDSDLMQEYYNILDSEELSKEEKIEEIFNYLENYSNEEILYRYLDENISLKEFAEFIVNNEEESINESLNEDVRPAELYDIEAGYLGNGLTVWDKSREEHGDYKTIAHIGETGEVTIYDKQIPSEILKQIYQWSEEGQGRTRTESQGIIGESFYPSLKEFLNSES